jgi:hypothetical protein
LPIVVVVDVVGVMVVELLPTTVVGGRLVVGGVVVVDVGGVGEE